MIEAYITNAGKYAEGKPAGEWLKFPTTKEEVQALLSRIGVDGVSYEEYFITDYRADIDGLCKYLSEYESVDELNYLAAILEDVDDYEFEKFVAAIDYGEYTSSAKDLINLTHNLENYEFYPGVENEEDLGRYYIEELSTLEVPEHLEGYFDYEAYGRDMHFNSNGAFSERCGGYVEYNRGSFIEHYSGRDDIPGEYRVFEYPAPPERGINMDQTKNIPIAQNKDVKELLELMESNNMPGAKDLTNVIGQVGAMEKHLSEMVTQLADMRHELAEAQRINHPIQTALRKAAITLQAQTLEIRDKLSALKEDIVSRCGAALGAFREKGLSALRNVADFFKIRPRLESLQKDIDKCIKQDEATIASIEKFSTEYHEAGRHIRNMGRTIVGKEAIQEAKPNGKIAKAFTVPARADRACLVAMRKCVSKAIGAVDRLEKTEHKPPIKETLEKMNKQVAQAGREAPALQRSVPEHTGR